MGKLFQPLGAEEKPPGVVPYWREVEAVLTERSMQRMIEYDMNWIEYILNKKEMYFKF